jgi:hypothetical protein
VRSNLPSTTFSGHDWRIPPPSAGGASWRSNRSAACYLQFIVVSLLYRKSASKQPAWVAMAGPRQAADLSPQRLARFKNSSARHPTDLLITDDDLRVWGGSARWHWADGVLGQIYSKSKSKSKSNPAVRTACYAALNQFWGLRKRSRCCIGRSHDISVEMWLSQQLARDYDCDSRFTNFGDGALVYRFFTWADLANVRARNTFSSWRPARIRLTPPKPVFEEKCFCAFVSRHLQSYWRQEV